MRVDHSDEDGVYGQVTLDSGNTFQVLFADEGGEYGDGIAFISGGESAFFFFVFLPPSIYETLVSVHSREVFDEALAISCKAAEERL